MGKGERWRGGGGGGSYYTHLTFDLNRTFYSDYIYMHVDMFIRLLDVIASHVLIHVCTCINTRPSCQK